MVILVGRRNLLRLVLDLPSRGMGNRPYFNLLTLLLKHLYILNMMGLLTVLRYVHQEVRFNYF